MSTFTTPPDKVGFFIQLVEKVSNYSTEFTTKPVGDMLVYL